MEKEHDFAVIFVVVNYIENWWLPLKVFVFLFVDLCAHVFV